MSFDRKIAAAVIVALLTTAVSFGAMSPQFADWPRTAVQWLMTRDEQRAWRDVKTDEQAQAFIDLFWARRDPTPGTPLNEFRREFEQRVETADRSFSTKTKRGSLTDMGRVYIVLGPPKSMPSEMRQAESQNPLSGDESVGVGHEYGARLQFVYANPIALGLTGPVVFIENMAAKEIRVDYQHSNVGGALARAVANAVVNPSLVDVPEWARTRPTIAPGPVTIPQEQRPVTTVTTPAPVPPPPAAPTVAGSRGAHDLTLVANARVIRAGEDRDPFARTQRKSSFRTTDDLEFAFVWCADAVGAPKPRLSVSIAMRATVRGEPVNVTIPQDEVDPEPLAKMAGCYLVRGSIPLQSLDPGTYRFVVSVNEGGSQAATPLEQVFTIE